MKHIINLRLSLTMVMLSVCTFTMSTVYSCGAGTDWRVDTFTGVMDTIGSGAMNDFSLDNSRTSPWYSYRYLTLSVQQDWSNRESQNRGTDDKQFHASLCQFAKTDMIG